jgi:hypothetical protein
MRQEERIGIFTDWHRFLVRRGNVALHRAGIIAMGNELGVGLMRRAGSFLCVEFNGQQVFGR